MLGDIRRGRVGTGPVLLGSGGKVMHRKVFASKVYERKVVLITGGTGFTGRDSTPEAVSCLLDKQVDGFGELFRQISVADIGTSTVQSRALAGLANGTLVCCLPGSTNAVRTGWDGILAEQLDSRHRPCNFVPHLKQADPCESRG